MVTRFQCLSSLLSDFHCIMSSELTWIFCDCIFPHILTFFLNVAMLSLYIFLVVLFCIFSFEQIFKIVLVFYPWLFSSRNWKGTWRVELFFSTTRCPRLVLAPMTTTCWKQNGGHFLTYSYIMKFVNRGSHKF